MAAPLPPVPRRPGESDASVRQLNAGDSFVPEAKMDVTADGRFTFPAVGDLPPVPRFTACLKVVSGLNA